MEGRRTLQRDPTFTRYVQFRGATTVLVGSGEHYGAVLNQDFDYIPYLDELACHGLNHCRVFSGTYREAVETFHIDGNTLAPREAAYLCPWRRLPGTEDHTPQLVDGAFSPRPIWDVTQWDERYWRRLHDFCQAASERGIVVEYVLFSVFFNRETFLMSPLCFWNQLHSPVTPERRIGAQGNNLYSVRTFGDTQDGWCNEMLPVMERFIERAVETLAEFDNVYFEVCNAPFWEYNRFTVALETWQSWVISVLSRLAPEKMISVNVQERCALVEGLNPAVDIVNFHYAVPEAVLANYHLGVVIADNETGYAGPDTDTYLREAWRFLLGGGGIFSHLDLSFTVAHPDGAADVPESAPGAGSAMLRRQLGFLRRFAEAHRLWRLRPTTELVRAGSAVVLSDRLRERVVAYVSHSDPLILGLGHGTYAYTWVDPRACRAICGDTVTATPWTFFSPPCGHCDAVLVLECRDRDEYDA